MPCNVISLLNSGTSAGCTLSADSKRGPRGGQTRPYSPQTPLQEDWTPGIMMQRDESGETGRLSSRGASLKRREWLWRPPVMGHILLGICAPGNHRVCQQGIKGTKERKRTEKCRKRKSAAPYLPRAPSSGVTPGSSWSSGLRVSTGWTSQSPTDLGCPLGPWCRL